MRNFTDVDDKIINRAALTGDDPLALAQRFIHEFHADMVDDSARVHGVFGWWWRSLRRSPGTAMLGGQEQPRWHPPTNSLRRPLAGAAGVPASLPGAQSDRFCASDGAASCCSCLLPCTQLGSVHGTLQLSWSLPAACCLWLLLSDPVRLTYLPLHLLPRPTSTLHPYRQVAMIERIIAHGHAYAVDSGDVFFDVASLPGYGRLSGRAQVGG